MEQREQNKPDEEKSKESEEKGKGVILYTSFVEGESIGSYMLQDRDNVLTLRVNHENTDAHSIDTLVWLSQKAFLLSPAISRREDITTLPYGRIERIDGVVYIQKPVSDQLLERFREMYFKR